MRSGHDYRVERVERQGKGGRGGKDRRPHGRGKAKTLRDHRKGCATVRG